ncbi:MAG: tetratricopeptide repeat protein [Deltaproteobacteria bacterium]|nr:tetratricopeptide repeat protein [Deltaproteobacteria bacterium]MBT4263925.1 tetratricopeptide repeat protein [Deltaproteobacteria bacterium]MBT4639868.1 tetratricopeptide repeat protein [Deltaproteobacteria bacterium]MBT6503447.1 tetratricopeptide repeat protein [Deltaproteobacteria bacterium]MBT6611043.1 tetratricopeptide repeat protein [Deltaproteobacteria bacterium]
MKPHNVIVRSSFKNEVKVPTLKYHLYNLFAPGEIQEPYLPDFDFEIALLPDDIPHNTTVGWLTKFSPSLARLFRGDSGRFENGLFFYQQNNLNKAESDLIALLNRPSVHREKAILYLAWIKYKDQLWKEAIKLSSHLLQSNEIDIVKEVHYLTSLIYIKQEKFKKVLSLNETLRSKLPMDQFDPKQIYVHLISLINLGSWKEAKSVSDLILNKSIAHSKVFFKIVELTGLIDYKNKSYLSSLKNYNRAKSYHALPAYQFVMNRHIAWLYYLTGNYESAVKVLQERNSQYLSDYTEERAYLKLACLVRLKKWADVSMILNGFKEGSIFRTYGSFLIRHHLKDSTEYPDLFKQVSAQKFNFPEMKFHVALLDGNLFYKRKHYQKAKDTYIRAMSVDSSSQDYWIAQFNLGLTHLKLRQYDQAEINFLNLMRTFHGSQITQLRYHLIYAQYQQSKIDPSWESMDLADFPSLNRDQQIELRLIQAGTLLRLSKRETAKSVFMDIWLQTKQQDALEFVIKISYDQRQFDKVINLVKEHPQHRSDTLITYEVKSLLAMRRFNDAKRSIEEIPADNDLFIPLRLEVWTANSEYKSIIKFISGQLRKALDKQQRRFYYLKLGDAYFNLQQYQKSKNQFYRALGLTSEPILKSLILYNIALSSYYYNDYASFLSEVNQVLSRKEITDEVRYNLTILLAEYYQKTNRLVQADSTLEKYSRPYTYNLASIHIKRIRIWFQAKNHKKCVKLGRTGVSGESEYQQRDRIIMFGYCANTIHRPSETIKSFRQELESNQNSYRINELHFILAQAYSQTGDFKRSLSLAQPLVIKPLNTEVRLETQLLLASNRLQLKDLKKAAEELGDVNQYRVTGQYVRSLHLKGEIELQQKQYHQAYRTLLRVYYLPDSSKVDQQLVLLRITEGYLSEMNLEAAVKHFKKIDAKLIWKKLPIRKRYKAAKASIKAKQPLSSLEQIEADIQGLFHVKQSLDICPFRFQLNGFLEFRPIAKLNLSVSDHGA